MSDVKAIIANMQKNPRVVILSVDDAHTLIDHVKAVEAERDASDEYVVLQRNALAVAERERDEQSSRIADLERQLAEARKAVDAYDEGMAHIGSCGDGGCLIMKPEGMHTNGGCRCWTDKYKAQRAMQRGRMLATAIRAMKQEAGE